MAVNSNSKQIFKLGAPDLLREMQVEAFSFIPADEPELHLLVQLSPAGAESKVRKQTGEY